MQSSRLTSSCPSKLIKVTGKAKNERKVKRIGFGFIAGTLDVLAPPFPIWPRQCLRHGIGKMIN